MRVSEAEQKQRRMHARVTQLFHVSAVNLYRGRRHSTRRLAVANYSANNPAQPPNFECIKRISAADVGVLSVTLCTFIAILSANTTERGRERERERERASSKSSLHYSPKEFPTISAAKRWMRNAFPFFSLFHGLNIPLSIAECSS